MKQTITNLSTVLLFASSGFSQVTITDAHAPSAGDAIVLSYDTLPILSIPASGTSQTWDYSGLAAHTMDKTTFQSSAGFTHIGDYPGSNLGMNEDGFEVFMTKNSSEF